MGMLKGFFSLFSQGKTKKGHKHMASHTRRHKHSRHRKHYRKSRRNKMRGG